jgi:hypothetical protein
LTSSFVHHHIINMADDALHLGASFEGPAHHTLTNHTKSSVALALPNAAEAREYARHTTRVVRRSKVNFTLGGDSNQSIIVMSSQSGVL